MTAEEQAIRTGTGVYGRVLLLADIDTLPANFLHLAVRDLLANLISIAQVNGKVLEAISPIYASSDDVELRKQFDDTVYWGKRFEALYVEIAATTNGTGRPTEEFSRAIALKARELALCAKLTRDFTLKVRARIGEIFPLPGVAA